MLEKIIKKWINEKSHLLLHVTRQMKNHLGEIVEEPII